MNQRTYTYYRFVYFNSRGAGEIIRLLLCLPSNPPKWEDVRYPLTLSKNGFAIDTQYQKAKEDGAFACNMNQLPILQVVELENINEKQKIVRVDNIGQSHTIARFLASKHELMGNGPMESAYIDNIYENVRDIKTKWFKEVKSSKDRYKAKKQWFDETLPDLCEKLEKSLPRQSTEKSNKSPWLVGSNVSLADVAVYHLLSTSVSITSGSTVSFFDGESEKLHQSYQKKCKRLDTCVKAVAAIPSIQSWEERRPDTVS